jgi:hypothetical protein
MILSFQPQPLQRGSTTKTIISITKMIGATTIQTAEWSTYLEGGNHSKTGWDE